MIPNIIYLMSLIVLKYIEFSFSLYYLTNFQDHRYLTNTMDIKNLKKTVHTYNLISESI